MDINEKLDLILTLLETVVDKQNEQEERLDELQESIANLSLPGSNYSIDSVED